MKYYIIAGERSGDLHGSNLIRELKKRDKAAEIRCWGGDMMKEAGGDLVVHYRETALMGFLEVVRNLRKIKGFLKKCRRDILAWHPEVLVLIDYPGFNLRIARFAQAHGFKVCYYISPKIWAWNQKRAYQIKRFVDRMFCILPFEKEFYKRFDYEVAYVGNPLNDSIGRFKFDPIFVDKTVVSGKKVMAILPGSRKQEVLNMMKIMAELFPKYPDLKFLVAGVSNLDPQLYASYVGYSNVEFVVDKVYDILNVADGAIVTSGTATLEVALMEVPQVVCYRTSAVSYAIAKKLIKVPFISLVNLIADREIVKELIQDDFNLKQLSAFVDDVMQEQPSISEIRKGYQEIKALIGNGRASETTAKLIYQFITDKNE